MADKQEMTMDRAGERLASINDRWLKLLQEWQPNTEDDKRIKKNLAALRHEFANFITPALKGNWRWQALLNGLDVPGREDQEEAEEQD